MLEKFSANRRSVITAASVALCAILLLSAFTGGGNSQSGGEAETLYRESTVQRGDITVGVSETAIATLKTHSLSFDVAAEIEEVFVKAGQAVKEGDPIASISTESIEEELSSLRVDYQSAALKLSDAQLSRQKGELEAQSSYHSTVNKSGTADLSLELTLDKLEQAVTKAAKNVEEIETEIRTYTTLLRYIGDYEDDYALYISTKEWYEDAQEYLEACQTALNDYKKTQGDALDQNSSEYQSLLLDVEYAKEDLEYARLEYEDAAEDYSEKYDTDLTEEEDIIDARNDAYERLSDAQAALKEAQYNLQIQSGEAELSRDETMSRAELADTTYQMELQSLANSVTSAQIAVQNVQEQIDKYTAYLEATLLTAPCDGIVTAVSAEAGAAVQSGTAVATLSDSRNVFVYISVTQDDITGVTLGQSCTVAMDAFEEITYSGVVDSITTTPARSASGSASYNVTIRLEGDTAQVYEGMSGTATLITRQQKDVLYVTTRTIYQKDGVSCVKVKHEDGAIEEVAVTTGFSDGRNVEIVSGLTEGQTVLIESQVAVAS